MSIIAFRPTLTAVRAAVAYELAAAAQTVVPVMRDIQLLERYIPAELIREPPLYGPPGEVYSGLVGHLALNLLARQIITPAVLDKNRAGLDKTKGDVVGGTLSPQGLHPVEVAGPGSVIVLAAADDLFYLSVGEIFFYAHRTDKRGAHYALVPEGQFQ